MKDKLLEVIAKKRVTCRVGIEPTTRVTDSKAPLCGDETAHDSHWIVENELKMVSDM